MQPYYNNPLYSTHYNGPLASGPDVDFLLVQHNGVHFGVFDEDEFLWLRFQDRAVELEMDPAVDWIPDPQNPHNTILRPYTAAELTARFPQLAGFPHLDAIAAWLAS